MSARLIQSLVASKNGAADDCLLEALRIGNDAEQALCFAALVQRRSLHGYAGLVGMYAKLSAKLQDRIRESLGEFHGAIREAVRSDDPAIRLSAMQLITDGRDGRLAYLLLDNLHAGDETLTRAAVKSLLSLSQWIARESAIQLNVSNAGGRETDLHAESAAVGATATSAPHDRGSSPAKSALEYQSHLPSAIRYRGEIETAVAKALDLHRGEHQADLLRAALLLCDWAGSKTLAILHTTKHGGQSPMVRRLQQPPTPEGAAAFLLGASHGQLRSHFHSVFSRINEAPVLDALLRRTSWLKDHQLATCVHHVSRGVWLGEAELAHDIERRTPGEAALIGEWIAATSLPDAAQDERLEQLRLHAGNDYDARLRLLRIAAERKRGSSTKLLASFLSDPDERLVRLATRELVRRRPPEVENLLLGKLAGAPDSVRRVISRSIGQAGFDLFWSRFSKLDRVTRAQSGKAMLKLLPDATARLSRRLATGSVEEQLKAMQIIQEVGLGTTMHDALLALCTHANAKVRSKAIHVIGTTADLPPDALIERLVADTDPRVRANTIELLEAHHKTKYLPLLLQRVRSANNRERANAIKAMHGMRVSTATGSLGQMLSDNRPEHRISALWALQKAGIFGLISQAVQLAKQDSNLKVRRYALGVVKTVIDAAQQSRPRAAV